MIMVTLPCLSLIGFPYSWFFMIFPGVAALKLIMGAYTDIPFAEVMGLSLYLVCQNYLFYQLALRVFEKKIVYQD